MAPASLIVALLLCAAVFVATDASVHVHTTFHHRRHGARHRVKTDRSPSTDSTKQRAECPVRGSALFTATEPALTSECPTNCAGSDLCVFFPHQNVSQCDSFGSAGACFRGDTCAFRCVPNGDLIKAWLITLYTDDAVLEEVWAINSESRMDKTVAINANVATSWIGDGRFFNKSDWLYITGNEAANNYDQTADTTRPVILPDTKYLSPSQRVDFEVTESMLANLPEAKFIRLENLRLGLNATKGHAPLSFPRLLELYLRNMQLTDFPFKNASMPYLYFLDLSVNNLQHVTADMFPPGLMYLNLSMNGLKSVKPGDLPELLDTLDIGGNGLTKIPPGTLSPRLAALGLQDNLLTEIPADVTSMEHLLGLVLDNNKLEEIPDNTLPTTQMSVLMLNNCGLRAIPADVWLMEQLTEIHLNDNDLSGQETFTGLPLSLTTILLDNTNLQQPPRGLEELPNLTGLSFRGNPKAVYDLSFIPSQVETLDLSNNSLHAIPTEIKSLTSVQDLWLQLNPIASIDPHALPRSLSLLLISNATFESLPQNALPLDLVTLVIENSNLEQLPDDIISMRKLLELTISKCRLSSFDVGGGLDSIYSIDLRHNRLTEFSGEYPLAQILDLRGNQLNLFNVTDGTKLHTLHLENNQLTSVPTMIFGYPDLLLLNLTGNPIRDFTPDSSQLAFLSRIPVLAMEQQMFATECDDQATPTQWRGFTVCVVDASRHTDFKSSYSGKISVGLVLLNVVLVLVLVFMIGFVFVRRRLHAKRLLAMEMQKEMMGERSNSSIWADAVLLQHRLDGAMIERVQCIGSGMFGEVWLAYYRDQRVAVKQLKNVDKDRQLVQQFVEEIKLAASLSHPRIVEFIGVVWTKETDLALVSEFMDGSDLRSLLESRQDEEEAWAPSMLQLTLDIAEAVVYLHSLDPVVIHRDLKSRNVLLDSELRAKLSDFGVSRMITDEEIMTAAVGTIRWVAPEVLAGQAYDESADIYSLGIILSEIDTHRLPFADATDDSGEDRLTDSAIAGMVVSGSLCCRVSATCPPEIESLISRCTAFERSDRPTAIQVAYELRTQLQASKRSSGPITSF